MVRADLARTEEERSEVLQEWKETKKQAAKDERQFWLFWFVVIAALGQYFNLFPCDCGGLTDTRMTTETPPLHLPGGGCFPLLAAWWVEAGMDDFQRETEAYLLTYTQRFN